MSEKTRAILVYAAVVAVLILLGVGAWFFMVQPVQTAPKLTREIALGVLEPELPVQCLLNGVPESYRSCTVEILKETEGPGWRVHITYDGLYDDSVKASRIEARLESRDTGWVVGDISHTTQCHLGRGHQEFSAELCA